MEGFLVPYSQRVYTMRLMFLLEALVENSNLVFEERWALWLRGCVGPVMGPIGAAHGSVLNPIHSAGLHRAAPLPLRGIGKKT